MKYYSYIIEHDYGLAPNPFHGYCTLAVCKPKIRNNTKLNIGDWIIGTGSVSLNKINSNINKDNLIFAMRLEEKITFNEYWNDRRFYNKKPIINGSMVQMYGDNFYHEKNGEFVQEDSAHSLDGGEINPKHREVDISGKYVLISQEFYYFGDQAPNIPNQYAEIRLSRGSGFKSDKIPQNTGQGFIAWLQKTYHTEVHGDPINWKKHISEQNNLSWDEQLAWEAKLMK